MTAALFNSLAARGFSEAEYAGRCRSLQQRMAAADIELLLFTNAADFAYYCGFVTPFWQSPTRPWFLLLPVAGKPIAVIPAIGAALMRNCYVSEVRTWASPHPHDDGVSLLAQTILDTGGSGRINLGMMRGRQSVLRMPPADFDALRARLPAMHIYDVAEMVQQQRMIKSKTEIDKIATACRMVSDVFSGWREWLAAGMTMREIFCQFKIRCLQAGVDDVGYLSGGMASGGYADVISPPDARVFNNGDILMLDSGCIYDGYYCDFDRNIACQYAEEDACRCYSALWQATEAGLQAAKSGRVCRQVFEAMHEVIADAGFAGSAGGAEVGRYGHGLGIELTEPPSIAPWDNTPLSPGMVLTLEPSALLDNKRLMVHEENIVINDSGEAILLTHRAPAQLPLLIR